MLNNKKLTALTTAITLMCMPGSLAAQEVSQQQPTPLAQQDAENSTVFKRVIPFSQLGYSGSIAIQAVRPVLILVSVRDSMRWCLKQRCTLTSHLHQRCFLWFLTSKCI